MLKTRLIRMTPVVLLALYVWTRAVLRAGGIGSVLEFSVAGVVSAITLTWICRAFASVTFTRRTLTTSAVAGFLIFTPLIYMLLSGDPDKSESAVVLAATAGCVAAMTGAVWSVAHLVRSAFAEWRNDRPGPHWLTMKEAHR
jgi:hypothetical protein